MPCIYLQINDTMLDGVRVVIYEPVFTYGYRKRAALIFLHGGGWSTLSVGRCQSRYSPAPLTRQSSLHNISSMNCNLEHQREFKPQEVQEDGCVRGM